MRGFRRGSQLIAVALFIFALSEVRAFAQLSFTRIEVLTNHEARLRLDTLTGTSARIDVSTNAIDWNGFMTVAAGLLTLTDTFAPYAPTRYYRAEQLDATAFTGDHLPTTNGDAVIHPVAHATFLLSWNGLTIYNDPTNVSYIGFPKADLIFIGHEHNDHFQPTVLPNIKATAGKIVTTQTVYNLLSTTLKASTIVLHNGDSTNLLGIQIDAIPAYNANHPQGMGNGYVLTMGGKRIYMSGDTGDIPATRALQNIDVAFLCMNVPYTMTVNQAAAVTRAFVPKVVYPYHFRNQDGTFANLMTFKNLVATDLGIEVRIRKWY